MQVQLAIGVKMMITENILMRAHISNGSRGTITRIMLDPREPIIPAEMVTTGRVKLMYPSTSIIPRLDNSTSSLFPFLQAGEVPLVPVTHNFKLASHTITQRQLPATPAYAFTDYRSQGQTIHHLLVDIRKTTSFSLTPFNAYVALSRNTGWASVRLLRNFEEKLFTEHSSEDLREEDEHFKN